MELDRFIFLVIVALLLSCNKSINNKEVALVSISRGPLNPKSLEIKEYELVISKDYEVQIGTFFYPESISFELSKSEYYKIVNELLDSGIMDAKNIKEELDIHEIWYCIEIQFKDKSTIKIERVSFSKELDVIDSLLSFEPSKYTVIKDYNFKTLPCVIIPIPDKLYNVIDIE